LAPLPLKASKPLLLPSSLGGSRGFVLNAAPVVALAHHRGCLGLRWARGFPSAKATGYAPCCRRPWWSPQPCRCSAQPPWSWWFRFLSLRLALESATSEKFQEHAQFPSPWWY